MDFIVIYETLFMLLSTRSQRISSDILCQLSLILSGLNYFIYGIFTWPSELSYFYSHEGFNQMSQFKLGFQGRLNLHPLTHTLTVPLRF